MKTQNQRKNKPNTTDKHWKKNTTTKQKQDKKANKKHAHLENGFAIVNNSKANSFSWWVRRPHLTRIQQWIVQIGSKFEILDAHKRRRRPSSGRLHKCDNGKKNSCSPHVRMTPEALAAAQEAVAKAGLNLSNRTGSIIWGLLQLIEFSLQASDRPCPIHKPQLCHASRGKKERD